MRRISVVVFLFLLGVVTVAAAQPAKPFKVFISVDIEGITGIANGEETSQTGRDYEYFRKMMTKEANAAVEGARAAGATEIIVRDAHGSARNIVPDLLDSGARLLRDWSGGPKGMMEGVDETFAAAIFIGYHAKAGTRDALLEHTMTGSVMDVSINGVSMPEAGLNGLIAGTYGVPVVFVSGDKALCDQAKGLFGEVETVAVKEGIGAAALNLHPDVAHQRIAAGVQKALGNLGRYKPYKLAPPYTMVVKLKQEILVYNAALFPGMKRTGDWELTYTSDKVMDAIFMLEMVVLR
jgi:D-amino peptidase